jgi:putative nucleotidyltransferase with HDIG domain
VNDQRHGLDVLNTVEGELPDPSPILRQAALLHDMGKAGASFSVLERSLTVFLGAWSPRLLEGAFRLWPGLARRYAIYADHARIGAERLRAIGAEELADVIAEHHEAKPRSEVTSALQRADHAN